MFFLLALILGFQAPSPDDGFLVIVSQSTPIDTVNALELRRVFLKQTDQLQGVRVRPMVLEPGHPLHAAFTRSIIGLKIDADRYRLEKTIQGGGRPPLEVCDEARVLVYVERNPGAIGYERASRADELGDYRVFLTSTGSPYHESVMFYNSAPAKKQSHTTGEKAPDSAPPHHHKKEYNRFSGEMTHESIQTTAGVLPVPGIT